MPQRAHTNRSRAMAASPRSLGLLLAFCLLNQTPHASAQLDMNHDTGVKPQETYDKANENISIATGNLNLTIPLLHLPGRNGHDLDLKLTYNSQQWTPIANYQQPGQNADNIYIGWSGEQAWQLNIPTLSMAGIGKTTNGSAGNNGFSQSECWQDFVLIMGDGSRYAFNGAAADCWQTTYTSGGSNGNSQYYQTLPFEQIEKLLANDGAIGGSTGGGAVPSFAQHALLDLTQFTNNAITVRLADGSQLNFVVPSNGGTVLPPTNGNPVRLLPSSILDSNGNVTSLVQNGSNIVITTSANQIVTLANVNAQYLPQSIQYTSSNGASESISINGQVSSGPSIPKPTFAAPAIGGSIAAGGVSGITPYVDTISFPNGLGYTFQYNQYGEILKVTYPSGGYTRYAYQATPQAYYIWTTSYGNYADRRSVVNKYVCRSSVTPAGSTSSGYVGSVATNNCPVAEDFTTYSRTPTTGQVTAATVTDPLFNQTVYQFNAYVASVEMDPGLSPAIVNQGADNTLLETSRTVYQGSSTPLTKVDTVYVDPSVNKGSDQPFSRTTTMYPSHLQSQTQWTRDFSIRTYSPTVMDRGNQVNGTYQIETGSVLEQRDYDYGSGQPGTLLRAIDSAYLATNPVNGVDYGTSAIYIIGKPTSQTTFDGSGKKVAQTTYEYDSYSGGITASGGFQHGILANNFSTSYMTRGNLTAVNRWKNTDGTLLTTRNYKFDDAGNILIAKDPRGNATTADYTDVWANNTCAPPSGNAATYATKFTNALGQITKYSYNSCYGTLATFTEPNNAATSFSYDLMDRRVAASYPDGGQSCLQYSDMSNPFCRSNPNPVLPISIVSSQKLSSTTSKVTTTVLDGLSRKVQSQLNSDPQKTILVDTSYDSNSRVSSSSNPYRSTSDSTYAITSFTYDALDRALLQINPGGSVHSFSYSDNTTTESDELSNSWTRYGDALGRMTKVVEPGGLVMKYSYDPLANLLSVNQAGNGGSDTPRTRGFTYDSLSRILTATNPETGTISYSYLNAGALCAGDVSLPCSKTDARSITATYSYDVLNRLTFKRYSDGTQVAAFGYDGNNENGTPLSSFGIASTYSIGRPSLTSNEINAGSAYSYDVMGRIITKTNNIPGKPGWNTLVSAAYDLAGDTTSLTYPDGRVIQQGFDAAARINGINYVSWNGSTTNLPQPYFSESSGYDAAGHLAAATVGNNLPYLNATYDTRERLSTQTYGPSNAPAWSKQYVWTANSNLQSQTDLITGIQRQFAYDNLTRLTSAQDIYSNLAVPSGSNGQTGSTSTSGSGAEETPGETGAIPLWTDPNDSNLLINADAPGSPGWGVSNATISEGVAAPDGTLGAFTFTGKAGSTDTYLADSAPSTSLYDGETVTGSVWLRSPAGNQTINLYFVESGSAGYDIPAYKQVVLTSSWQQYQLSGQFHYGHQTILLQIGGASTIVAGQSVSLWGATLQDTGTSSPTITNFLPFSQRVTATSWGLNALATDNATQAPDGTSTAASVTGTSADSFITDTVKNPAPYSGQTITASVWLRAPSGSQRLLLTLLEDGNAPVGGVYVNLTGVWQRFQVSGTNSHTLNELALQIGGASTWSNGQVVQIWGAQMEFASSTGPYVATAGVPEGKEANLTNILPYSQQLSGASWGTSGVILANNALAAPDGSVTAAQMTGPQGVTDAYVTDDVPNPSLYDAATVTGSVFLRCPSGTKTLGLYFAAENASGRTYLAWGTVTLTTTWQRFTYTGQLPNALTRLFLQIGGSSTFQAGQVVYAWGAQMELASHAGPYVTTTALPVITGSEPVNILPVAQVLNGPSWGIANGTATPNVAGAPDGTSTAATVTAASSSTDTFAINSVPNPSLYDGQTVTASIYLRVASGTLNTDLFLINVGANGWSAPAQIPVAITTSWQRFAVTGTNQNGLSQLSLQIGGAGTVTSAQSFQVWGAQMVLGSDPAPYTPTSSSTTVYATGQAGTLVQNGLNQTYSYDSFGNILQNGSFESSYAANNQMVGFAYDAAGNVLSDGMNIMTWDAESRMATASGATYIYDAEGNRVEKQGSAVTDTVYFGGQPIARYSGGQWTDLVYGPTGLLAEVPGTQTASPVYRVTDNLGTNVGSLLANGTFVNPIDHTPFGQVFAGNTNDPYLFTGKERDSESGLDYFGARYYASNMGRWMSPDWSAKEDPVPYAKLDNPQSFNLYAYVGNNPLSRVDPDGHACTAFYGNSGWTGSSGFCDRASEYRRFDSDPAINSRTRFFGAAAIVSNSLGDVDAWRVIVRPLGVSSTTGSILEGIGRTLQAFNEGESHLVASGALGSGPALDRQLVHNEQSVVQGALDGLQGADSKGYDKAIGEINGSLNGLATRALEEIAPSDRAYAGILAGVRKNLGRDIKFQNQSDREAIGNAQTQALRNQQH